MVDRRGADENERFRFETVRSIRPRGSAGVRRTARDGAPTLRALDGLDENEPFDDLRVALTLDEANHARAQSILRYVVTEFVNNAIDHSLGREVDVALWIDGDVDPPVFRCTVTDDGLGAFETLRATLGLDDHLDAVQQLSKGKLTTMPERHSGEGLFFSSKALDHFELEANGLVWIVEGEHGDWTIASANRDPSAGGGGAVGTTVRFALAATTTRRLVDVFDRYTTDLAFDRTRVRILLFEYGTTFVSRSDAKRVARDLDRFREVLVDFRGVVAVGQGFVDELFRVWANAHPGTRLVPENMTRTVAFMVRRGLAEQSGPN
ncbi:MAG: DUF4325 domain-containing protein [Planctomycetota bacterium]